MWLHSLLASWAAGLCWCPDQRAARPRSFRPRLEALEDRCVPSTLNVTSNADTGAVGTLRWAVGVANAATTPDTIDILTTQPIVLTQGQLLLSASKGMNIEATAGMATISGGGLSRVFEMTPGSGAVSLNGLTITGGEVSSGYRYGGAIWDDAGGALTLTNCTLSDNSVSRGLGGAIETTNTLTVIDCALSGNSAGYDGGAIWAGAGLKVENSTLSGNSAGHDGGAVFDSTRGPFAVDFEGSTFSDNSAQVGGAIYGNYVQVSSCTFTDNSAVYDGGAIAAMVGELSENRDSGSLYSYIAFSSFSGNTPTSSILWGNGESTYFYGYGDTGLPPGAIDEIYILT